MLHPVVYKVTTRMRIFDIMPILFGKRVSEQVTLPLTVV